jgi:hypothetical protein
MSAFGGQADIPIDGQCPLMDQQQAVQIPYFRVVPFIGGGRLSSVKSNSFSVNLQSILGSRMCKFDNFLGDKSCCRIITNFQPQRIAGRYKGSRHILDGFRVKSLTGKKGSDRHDILRV